MWCGGQGCVTNTQRRRAMGKEELTIWTVGHSARTLDEFVELLTSHGIEAVADVRRYAGSRKHPQFHQEALRDTLAGIGVEYVPLPELGGRRRPRPESHNTVWRNAAFRGYADYLETAEFRAGIERLLDLARRRRTAILCAEAVWWRCHRSLIADYLKAGGICVRHILGAKKEQLHPYTSAARLRQGKLSYVPDAGTDNTPSPGIIKPRSASAAIPEGGTIMARSFKIGDHVTWNSEAGYVSGKIIKIHRDPFDYKGYTHHASKDDPQYEIQSDKTDHIAVHKAKALRKCS